MVVGRPVKTADGSRRRMRSLKRSLKRSCKKLVVIKFLTDATNRAGIRENNEQDVP